MADVGFLVCQGAVKGNRYLDGRTGDGSVGLAPSFESFSGTRWHWREGAGNVFTFECLGENKNPDHRFLDGRTADGTVGLAPSTDPPFTGTRWTFEVTFE
jgi:hypothetical protein